MLIQLYEITTPEEARALSDMGVDHVGVLVGDGAFPREQSLDRARMIFAGVRSGAKKCALSLSADLNEISAIATALEPDILHLGCAPQLLNPADMRRLKSEHPRLSIMRSIPVVDEASIALARQYDGVADYLLLDSYRAHDKQIGALGIPHDWQLDRRIVESVRLPVIVAGGLGPDDVAAAIAASRPAGVDAKTKTDKSDGSHTKDLAKCRAFVAAVRAAARIAPPRAPSRPRA
jgi:phosphoribosylanthranilate isomerase